MNKLLKARWEFGFQVWNQLNKREKLFDPWDTTDFRIPFEERLNLKLGRDYYFAGGCIRCKWDGLKTKDYDIYVNSQKAQTKIVQYYTNSDGFPDRVVIEKNFPVVTINKTIQVILTDKSPEQLIKTFDFRCNQFAYDGKVIATPEAQIDASLKILRFNQDQVKQRGYALNSVSRTWHFRRRGYHVPDETIEMAYQLRLNPNANSEGPK